MIFSQAKWNHAVELRKHTKVSSALSWEIMEAPLASAYAIFVAQHLGEELSNELNSYYNAPDPAQKEMGMLLDVAQDATANLAFYHNYHEINTRITDSGMQRSESETYKSLYKYQERDLIRAYKEKGYNAIERMLGYLEQHIDVFDTFKKSPSYSGNNTLLVQKVDEVQQLYNINNSRLIFLALLPHLQAAQDITLRDNVGLERWKMITGNKPEDMNELGYETLIANAKKFIIYQAIIDLILASGKLTEQGLYYNTVADAAGNDEKETAAEQFKIQSTISMLSSRQKFYLREIKQEVQVTEDTLPIFSIKRDNTNKHTVWL